jgi:sortase A
LPVPIAPPPPGTVEPEFQIGTIEIPRIDVVKNLYSGITMATLDKGPGYWPGTALPGEIGNTVVAGHRTSKDRPFRRLDELVPGDEIIFTTGKGRHVYAVRSTEIVTPDALWIVDQTYDRTATLFACHPPGSVDYRIVVYADLVDSPSAPDQT